MQNLFSLISLSGYDFRDMIRGSGVFETALTSAFHVGKIFLFKFKSKLLWFDVFLNSSFYYFVVDISNVLQIKTAKPLFFKYFTIISKTIKFLAVAKVGKIVIVGPQTKIFIFFPILGLKFSFFSEAC